MKKVPQIVTDFTYWSKNVLWNEKPFCSLKESVRLIYDDVNLRNALCYFSWNPFIYQYLEKLNTTNWKTRRHKFLMLKLLIISSVWRTYYTLFPRTVGWYVWSLVLLSYNLTWFLALFQIRGEDFMNFQTCYVVMNRNRVQFTVDHQRKLEISTE